MNICIYGASSYTISKEYIEAGEMLGRKMAQRGHGLVFGGGTSGLMGAVARGMHENSGYIKGVAPSFFNVDGRLYEHCTEFIYTGTMRERKQIMEDSSDAFIATPGGIGTFEEYFEILTAKQLGRHNKPIVLFNICGYYDKFEEMIRHAVINDFMSDECLKLYKYTDSIDEALDYIENYNDPEMDIFNLKHLQQ